MASMTPAHRCEASPKCEEPVTRVASSGASRLYLCRQHAAQYQTRGYIVRRWETK